MEIRKKDVGFLPAALMASMLGFASATELAPTRAPQYRAAVVEREIDDALHHIDFQRHSHEAVILPHYSGRISDILPADLAYTGALVKEYAPRLFVPNPGIVTIQNVTHTYSLATQLFHVYDFDDPARVLQSGPRVLLANNQEVSSTLSVLRSAATNANTASSIVDQFAKAVETATTLPQDEASRIHRAMQGWQPLLTETIQVEFAKIHAELDYLNRRVSDHERVLAESAKHSSSMIDLKKAIRGIPQRAVESTVDATIKAAAIAFVKLIALPFL